VFFLAAGDVRSQKKRVRLFLGFRVFLGSSMVMVDGGFLSFWLFCCECVFLWREAVVTWGEISPLVRLGFELKPKYVGLGSITRK
jgi:hypothetical protein